MLKILFLAFLVVFAHTVQTITGFGSNAFSLPVGVHIFPIDQLIVVLVVISTLQVLWLTIRNYSKIQWSVLLKRIYPSCMFGMPLGMMLYYNFDVNQLKLFLGSFIILVSVSELYRLFKTKTASTPLKTPAAFAGTCAAPGSASPRPPQHTPGDPGKTLTQVGA